MEKGHYGHYTGNARHSRKEEMIHDRELIYDAKTQIHHEDEKYKHTGKDSYKQDMIHERELIHDTKTQLHHADSDYKGDSPAHISYSSKFGGITLKDPESTGAYARFDGGAAGDISAMRQKAQGLGNLQKSISNTVSDYYDKKPAGKKESSVKTSIPSVSDVAAAVPKATIKNRESMTFREGTGNFSGQSAQEKLGRKLTGEEKTWMEKEIKKHGLQGYRNKYGIGSQDYKNTTVTGFDLKTD